MWLAFHIALLIGFRNRIVVLINWAWDYFLYERAVRLITAQTRERAAAFAAEREPDPDSRSEHAA